MNTNYSSRIKTTVAEREIRAFRSAVRSAGGRITSSSPSAGGYTVVYVLPASAL